MLHACTSAAVRALCFRRLRPAAQQLRRSSLAAAAAVEDTVWTDKCDRLFNGILKGDRAALAQAITLGTPASPKPWSEERRKKERGKKG